MIGWYDAVAAGIERTVTPRAADEFALTRWAAHGYQTDPASLSDTAFWTQLNQRDLTEVEHPVLPDGFRFRTADEAGPQAAVQAHVDAWAPSTYTAEGYQGVRRTATYRGDLHVLVQAPDGTMAASTIMWLDEANRTAEFEPVGTHPGYRRLGLGTAMLRHGMQLAREAGATHMTVACCGGAGATGGARAVLRRRVPAVHPGRAAHQACGLGPSHHKNCWSLPFPHPHRYRLAPSATSTRLSRGDPDRPVLSSAAVEITASGALRAGQKPDYRERRPSEMLRIIVVALIAIVALSILSFSLHILFSPWLLLPAIGVLLWIKLRPRRSHR